MDQFIITCRGPADWEVQLQYATGGVMWGSFETEAEARRWVAETAPAAAEKPFRS
jgi:hypothetical protein